MLGLLGRTGSGKSTIGRLLLRLHDPTGGAIRIAGADLRSLLMDEVRRRVGLVTQEVQLFHASVRDNLTLYDPTVPDARIEDILRELELSPWLASLPAGLDTRLAPGGGDLSAGEAQLLAFARVFLQDPGLVVLDEASSRLDPGTERRLERAVDRLLGTGGAGWGDEAAARTRTAVVIAHRLSTIQRADHILILDEGRVLEYGPRTALAADPATHFSRLLHTGSEVLV